MLHFDQTFQLLKKTHARAKRARNLREKRGVFVLCAALLQLHAGRVILKQWPRISFRPSATRFFRNSEVRRSSLFQLGVAYDYICFLYVSACVAFGRV